METQTYKKKKDELLQQKIEWHKKQILIAEKDYEKIHTTSK